MVKSNIDILSNNSVGTDIEIKGSTNEIILELSTILMRIKASDDQVYKDILNSMEIINNSIDVGVEVDDLQDIFIKSYLKTLKKDGKNNG